MGKRSKDFEKWKNAKAPVSADKVKTLLERVYAGRIKEGEGTSHRYKLLVPELKDHPDYPFGLLVVPLKNGQQVKAAYLQLAYEAAVLLGLHQPQETDEDNEDHDAGEDDL